MQDRRQWPRHRVFYGGLLSFNAGQSNLACTVRNMTDDGARLDCEDSGLLPDAVDLAIPRKKCSYLATVVWRNETSVGVSLRTERATAEIIPIDVARRLADARDKHRAMQDRLEPKLTGD